MSATAGELDVTIFPRPSLPLEEVRKLNEDNAVLTAGLKPFEADAKAQKLAGYLGARGINMIYEHVRPERNDCSFSFHVKLNGLGDYYNIEVEHGRVAEQKAILDVLMAYLGVKPVR